MAVCEPRVRLQTLVHPPQLGLDLWRLAVDDLLDDTEQLRDEFQKRYGDMVRAPMNGSA